MNSQRTNKEYMLITLSMGGVVSILPFAIYRLVQGEWFIGIVDTILVLGMAGIASYVYVTHEAKAPSIILTTFALLGMVTVVYLRGPSAVFWAYPTMVGVYFILAPREAIQLTLLAALLMAPALFNAMQIIPFIAVGITLVVNNLFAYFFAKRMQRQQDQLSMLVRRDPLTGAGNRRALNEKLSEVVVINKRSRQFVSLVVLDVDFFKSINDNYGHAVGDQVLINLTDLISKRIRESDNFYRYGGEEFVVVLTGTGQAAAVNIAEQFRHMVETSAIMDNMLVTISLGVAEYDGEENSDSWLERADTAMYQAKETGRNKVCEAALKNG